MAIDALQLRPRGTIALFDAAVRVCATSAGVWAITLPSGAALVASLFAVVDAAHRRTSLTVPVLLMTAAWCFRAISQGAASHHLEHHLLAPTPASVRQSFLAAFKRAPALITAAAYLAVINVALLTLTAGLGFLVASAHLVGYAAVMRGQGGILSLYKTCSTLLGAARSTAVWLRVCGWAQLMLFFNLHLGAAVGLQIAHSLLGLEVTFASRFVSMDNGVWVATLAVATFALFEPVRAATAALLLLDGRVRQEGLDLLATAEQLPRRRAPKVPTAAALALVLLLPCSALAQGSSQLVGRVARLTDECDIQVTREAFEDVEALTVREQAALSRFVSRVERIAYDDQDCDWAEEELLSGLEQISAARLALADADARSAQDSAKAILARPEFQEAPPPEEKPMVDAEEAPPSWLLDLWERFWKAILDWLKSLDDGEEDRQVAAPSMGTPMFGAQLVVIVAIVLVVGLLVYILLKFRKPDDVTEVEAQGESMSQRPLEDDAMSALSRPPETWAGLADELARKGQFREAIRHLYLALLSNLHRAGAIDYDTANSNWDYLKAFKGPGTSKRAFRDLTLRFDFAWYGHQDVHAGAWGDFRNVAEPLLKPAEEATGA